MNTLWTKWEGTRNKEVFHLLLLAKEWDLMEEITMLIKIINMISIGHQSWDLSTISTTSAWVKTMDYPVRELDLTSIITVKKNFRVTVVTTDLHCQTTEEILKVIIICSRTKMVRNLINNTSTRFKQLNISRCNSKMLESSMGQRLDKVLWKRAVECLPQAGEFHLDKDCKEFVIHKIQAQSRMILNKSHRKKSIIKLRTYKTFAP